MADVGSDGLVYVTCNPNKWSYIGSTYAVRILTAQTDKSSYRPGETVKISGTIQLAATDYYKNECGESGSKGPYAADPSGISVTLQSPLGSGTVRVGSGGAFDATVQISDAQASGAVSYTIVASYGSRSDSTSVSFQVEAYAPRISATPAIAYPGNTVVVAGAGWAPGKTVTAKFFGQQREAAGPTFAVEFVVPDNANEGPHNILATQEPRLQATTPVIVQWRPIVLAVTVMPSIVTAGSSATIRGTVTSNNGPVAGANVIVNFVGIESANGAGTTDAGGGFGVTFTVPPGAYRVGSRSWGVMSSPPAGTVSVTATKAPGYKSPSNTVTANIQVGPPWDWALLNPLVDFGILSSLYLVGISVAQVAAISETAYTTAIFTGAVTSIAGPVTVAALSAGALAGLLYYSYRNPEERQELFRRSASHG